MAFQDLVTAAQGYFPKIKVAYKDQSSFMKMLGTLLFFNKDFMTQYVTTIGNTIYFPSQNYVSIHPISSAVVFMHEFVHVYDSTRLGQFLFGILYLLPQWLFLLAIPLFFISWKIALPFLLFAAPLPAYFRMVFEKRAYISSVYTLNALGQRLNFNPLLNTQTQYFISQFKDPYYYWMWPFSVSAEFNDAVLLVQSGKRPYDDKIFDMLDNLVTKV